MLNLRGLAQMMLRLAGMKSETNLCTLVLSLGVYSLP